MKWTNFLLTILIFFFLSCMIANPSLFLQAGLDGLSTWALCVLPSILPFMFFTKLLSSLGTLKTFSKPFSKLSCALFRAPEISFPTFCMAILSGYPVGSKAVANLFMQGQITQEEAFRMISFCSTSGPMFIVGAVGVGMFGSSKIGYILFASHVLGAILNGIIFRNLGIKRKKNSSKKTLYPAIDEEKEKLLTYSKPSKLETINQTEQCIASKTCSVAKTNEHFVTTREHKSNSTSPNKKSESKPSTEKINLSELVLDCAQSVLSVGVIITIFFIVIQCLSPIFSLLPENMSALFSGIIEITKGCKQLSVIPGNLSVIMCSFVISFGGISTILQSLTMLSSIKMPVKLFITQKISHAILSTLFTCVLLLFC